MRWTVFLVLLLTACDSGSGEGDDFVEITTLFAYTPAAADSMGDVASYVQHAMRETNAVYAASKIPIRLKAVHMIEVTPQEDERLTLLAQLLDTDDSVFSDVHEARDEHEADIVILISEFRAATINAAILAEPESAFAIVWFGGLGAPFYAMAHEIGHLQGARHETVRDPVDLPFPYGHGFRGERYRTIMAGGPAPLAPRFSGPDQTYDGVVLGDSVTTDVARVLRETAVDISNFRGPRAPTDFVPPGTWPTLQ